MNWFTKEYAASQSEAKKTKMLAENDCCEHVSANPALLYVTSFENDPWGREGHCSCEECFNKATEEDGCEEVVCHDCKETKVKSQTREWTWYDFYKPQGDVPLCICDTCLTGTTHTSRVSQDKYDYEQEMGNN